MAMKFGKMNFAVGFNRQSAFPLDANSYFEDLTSAQEAAAGAAEVGSSDSAYYIGQLIIVKEENGVALYQIDTDKTLKKFGQAASADELAGQLDDLTKRVDDHETKIGNALMNGTAKVNGKTFDANEVTITSENINHKDETLYTTLESLVSADSGLQASVKNVSDALNTYKTSNDNALATTNSNVETIKTDVSEYKTSNDKAVKANADAIDVINGKLGQDASGNDIETTYTKISDFNTYKTSNDKAVQANASEISALKEKVIGGMHFKGKLDEIPATDSYEAGDFIIVGTKEYILSEVDGTKSWDELGDEGSHLTKVQADGYYDPLGKAQELINGLDVAKQTIAASKSIATIEEVDGKIAVTTQDIKIAQSQVTGLSDSLTAKQDKITEDSKLDASLIENLPTVDLEGGEGITIATDESTGKITISGKAYSEATTSAAGLMSADDKTKLDGIAEGAQVNVIETIRLNTKIISTSEKEVNIKAIEKITAGDGIEVSGGLDNVTISFDGSVLDTINSDISTLKSTIGSEAENTTVLGRIKNAEGNITTLSSRIDTLDGAAIKEVQLNGTKIEPSEGVVNVELGALASKDKIAEADVEQTLLDKIVNVVSSVNTDEFTLTSGKLGIKAVSTDKITQGSQEFILNGGSAAA